jgi:Beta-lactamase class C and other penicillin binding proteins
MRWRSLIACCLIASVARGAEAPAPARIDHLVRAYMEREHIPGVAVVALRGDRVILAQGWGYADVASRTAMIPDAVQPIYSISKHMTAAGVLALVDEGRLDVGAPVALYLPEWFADEPQLQLLHLLRHTSGLPEFIGLDGIEAIESGKRPGSVADVIGIVDRAPRRFAPGTWHSYSNSNYSALALIVERVHRKPLTVPGLEDCATSRARGVRWSTGYTQAGKSWTLPANLTATYVGNGGMCSSARSLALWMRALAAGRILPASRVQEMIGTAALPAGFTPPYGYGLSTVTVAGRPAWSHAGGGEGWGAWVAYLPDDELTVVVFGNRGWLWSTDLGVPIVRALLGQPEPPRLQRLPLSAQEREVLASVCDDGLFDFKIEAGSYGVVVTVAPFGDPIVLQKQALNLFVSALRPDTFRLTLRAQGAPPEFDWMEHRSYLRPCGAGAKQN